MIIVLLFKVIQCPKCPLGSIFLHRAVTNANRHLRSPFFLIRFLIDFWPSLEASVRYKFPAWARGIQSRSYCKIYFDIAWFSYDFWASVCLEVSVCLGKCLSVWASVCLFGQVSVCLGKCLSVWASVCLELSVCLDGQPVSRKKWNQTGLPKVVKTIAKQLGIDNFLAPELPGRVKPLQRCLLESIFLDALWENGTDTFDKAV